MSREKQFIKKSIPVNDSVWAVQQTRYGEPNEVLNLGKLAGSTLKVGPGDIVVAVSKRLIHPGDIQQIRGVSSGGPPVAIDPTKKRVPGYEGVGVIEFMGADVRYGASLSVGQRVAFFSGLARSWATKVVVPAEAAIAIPEELSDRIATQLIINTITAKTLLRASQRVLPEHLERPIHILQTAAGSAVGRIVSRLAMDMGFVPIRLVRTAARASTLSDTLPGTVIATDSMDWEREVRTRLGGRPLHVAIDAVGGSFLNEVALLLADGSTIVNFGWLGSGAPDLSSFAPRNLTLKGISIGIWSRLSAKDRAADLEAAIKVGQEHPELFEVAAEFPLKDFLEAIRQAGGSSRSAAVLLTS